MRRYPEYYSYRETMRTVSKDAKKLLKGKDKRFLKSMLENKMTGLSFSKVNKKVAQNNNLGIGVYGGFSAHLSAGGDGCVGPYFEIDKINIFKDSAGKIRAFAKQDSMLSGIEVKFFENPTACDMVDRFALFENEGNSITIHLKDSKQLDELIKNFDKYEKNALDDLKSINDNKHSLKNKMTHISQKDEVKEVENFETITLE